MATCTNCEGEFEPAELDRHERNGFLRVHCPECGCAMGSYYDRTTRS
ncbi:MAG: hypothetical protein ABEH77_05160 [Halobacteriaceae archaeon]